MRVISGDNTVFVDIDDTLILWSDPGNAGEGMMLHGERFWPHWEHVQDIRRHKARGHTVVIWSAGGAEWAARAVQLLELASYVDVVMCKPKWFIDDKRAEEFMPEHIRYFREF